MGAQDRTERVLREMHVLFSKAQPYEGSTRNVIVDKNAMMDLLKELNECMYDMMEEHELTVKSRDKANREMQKQGDDIVFDATRKAEDIYAASLMYTDNALESIQNIVKESQESVAKVYAEAIKKTKVLVCASFEYLNGKEIDLEKVFENISYVSGIDCDSNRELKFFEF